MYTREKNSATEFVEIGSNTIQEAIMYIFFGFSKSIFTHD